MPLTRDRVLRAAMAMADEGGIESLSMRKLAQALGVEAMSLYYHVASKDDIVGGILGLAMAEVELPPDDLDWKEALRASATSVHDVLERHPWAAAQMMSPNRVSDARIRWMDAVLGRLRQAGFSANQTHHAYHALDSHITGSTLWESGYSAALRNAPVSPEGFLNSLPEGAYPYLVEHIHTHMAGPDDIAEFDFGLGLILDSLERTLAQSADNRQVSEQG
ncbi:MAG TPA: TetR/AcrR family transcriptional regulator C-terminal domain-containing protein [Candidatus Limnocylindrales bacterium]|nr:TetR/AcrR family transcriptional regulator C-terminal domain-containing protein [Candidatus Limnocylindrales bacterium]